jgi:thiosulfate/3-mercaptopyruvate sulfurtransferase
MLASPAWLKDNLADPKLVLFHVGAKADFDKEHIPGAQLVAAQDLSIPRAESALLMQLLPPEPLRDKLQSLGVSDDSRIVVYFATDQLAQAARVYVSIDAAGLADRTAVLDGGLPAWKAAGGAVTDAVKPVAAGRITAPPHPEVMIELNELREGLGKSGLAVVDARPPDFFEGRNAGAMPRAGRIPGAKNIPASILATPEFKLKTDAELGEIFNAAGIRPGDTVASYCHSGQLASAVYLAAKHLGLKARVYDGSWDEWSRRDELPLEIGPIK